MKNKWLSGESTFRCKRLFLFCKGVRSRNLTQRFRAGPFSKVIFPLFCCLLMASVATQAAEVISPNTSTPDGTENVEAVYDTRDTRDIIYTQKASEKKDIPVVPENYQLQVSNWGVNESSYFIFFGGHGITATLVGPDAHHPYDWGTFNFNGEKKPSIEVSRGEIRVRICIKGSWGCL